MEEISKFKDELIFEVQKEFWNERGKGARYRLTRIGVPFFEEKLGKDQLKDKESIKKWLVENGFCEEIDFKEEDVSLNISVKNCCLKNIRDYFAGANMKPLGCPVANIFMYCLELNSGLAPELLPIESEGDSCKLSLAKMATSDVVTR
ncbi:hypothetical protein [Thermoanaerobacterium sp. DL9XJH110]|uniref:hypothetical protein n=1 Tax=Thermoanaerobacterium sp. DL9XJH110 TaxID=3386643 RepID=UPI003BB7A12D